MTVTWPDLQVGRIVRYQHLSTAKRLAGEPLTIRRGRLVHVDPPTDKRYGQITVEVLNNNGTVNARLRRSSTFLHLIVSVEPDGEASS